MPANLAPANFPLRRVAIIGLAALLCLVPLAAAAQIEAPTATRLVQSAETSAAGTPVRLTATVIGPGLTPPPGVASFRDAGAEIGRVALVGAETAFTRISTGDFHACGLTGNGRVFCWGDNNWGQLGNGNRTDSLVPMPVDGISNAVSVSAGGRHSCAVVASGGVFCWGTGSFGQLGNGSSMDSLMPVPVTGITTAMAVSAGSTFSCAVLSTGAVRCWGAGGFGQLGNGATADSNVPVAASIIGAVAVTSGGGHSCALLTSGAVRCWGRGDGGQLGNGSSTNSPVSVSVAGLGVASAVAAGGSHSCAVLRSGEMRCWGGVRTGQGRGVLGNGSWDGSLTPVAVTGITTADGVSAGLEHSCAVLTTGAARCWGFALLGDGTRRSSNVPVAVVSVSTARAIAAGASASCVLLAAGEVQCWGAGTEGQLGRNSQSTSFVPLGVFQARAHATLATGALAVGTRALSAAYPGAGGFAASTSPTLGHVVTPGSVGFVGGGAVFAQTEACAPILGTNPHPVSVRYSPSELGALPSGVSIVWRTGAEHLALWGAMAPSAQFFGGAGRASWTRFVFYPTRPLIRVVNRQITAPAGADLAGAQDLSLRLRVQNFGALQGCSVTMVAVLRRS